MTSDSELRPYGKEPTKTPLMSLTASAARITGKTLDNFSDARKKFSGADSEWQAAAWDMYDLVGELRFLVNTLAERMSKARLYLGKIDPSNVTNAPDEVTDSDYSVALEAFGKTNSGREQLLKRLAINLYIPGDGWFIGVPGDILRDEDARLSEDEQSTDEQLDLEWFMLSVSEVTMSSTSKDKVKLNLPGREGVELGIDEIHLIRIWNPHPRNWERADSPTKASLPVLKELVGLTMHVSAQVTSRLAGAGILVVPASAQRALQQAAGLEPGGDEDEFTEALIAAMMTPIEDRSNASAVVPLVVTVPDEVVEKFQHITFSTPLDSEARNLREEAIRRLALSQDAPPEVLLGTAGMNHWGGWLVSEEVVSTHLEPTLAMICDALTIQYLWPTLTDIFGIPQEEAEKYVIWYDVSHLSVRPNQSQDAFELHKRGVISDDQLRKSVGFDDDPEYEKLDRASAMALKMVIANPGLLITPGMDRMVIDLRRLLEGDAGKEGFILPPPEGEVPAGVPDVDEAGAPPVIPQTDTDPPEVPET